MGNPLIRRDKNIKFLFCCAEKLTIFLTLSPLLADRPNLKVVIKFAR